MAEKKTTAKKTTKKTTKKKAEVKKPEKVLKPEVIEKPFNLLNPIMAQSGNVNIISHEEEVENKIALMEDIDSIASLNKQLLAVKRENTQLEIQNKSLDEAKRALDATIQIMDIFLDNTVMSKVKKNIKSARDIKELATAYGILTDKVAMLTGDNVLETLGAKKRMKISVAFQNDSGDKTGVQVEV